MIRITVELISANGEHRDRVLGVGQIVNVGGNMFRGNYRVRLSKMQPKQHEDWKTGRLAVEDDDRELLDALIGGVNGFDRKRRGCWDLLYLALREIVGTRNP